MEQPTKRNRNRVAGIAFLAAAILTVTMALRARHQTLIVLSEAQGVNDAVQAVLDSENIGYAIMDENQQIIEWNPALARLSGWTKDQVKERGLEPLMGAEQWAQHKAAFAEAIKKADVKRTAVINCEIPAHEDVKGVPVRITVRLVRTRRGSLYAIAHVDRASRVIEIEMKK